MTQLPLITETDDSAETPLPLIVAQRWNFPLAHIQTETGMVYAVQDWMRGLLGEQDVRHLISMLRQKNPQIDTLFRMYPYTASNKIYQRPYTNENGLILLLVYLRLSRGRNRLAEIRNFIANFSAEYDYLKCRNTLERVVTESDFQADFTKLYSLNLGSYKIYQHYPTPLNRVIDILICHKHPNNQFLYLLIECKVQNKDFFKAIGQIIAYQSELNQSISNANWITAIAMPYEIIDDYMREITPTLPIHLITILNEMIIDVVTGEPFINIIGRQAEETSLLMEMDLATGKPLLPYQEA